MVTDGNSLQFCVRLGSAMAAPAGKIETDLPRCQRAIFIKLVEHARVNCNHVGAEISDKTPGVGRTVLDQAGRMAIGAGNTLCDMDGIILELGFLEVAVLA